MDTPRYCTHCGGVLTLRVLIDRPRRICPRCGAIHYEGLSVAASTVTEMPDGSVVLVRRAIEPGYGGLALPGGFVENGETVEGGAIRETLEETGVEVALDRLIGVFSYPGSRVAVAVYAAHPTGGRLLAASSECLEVRAYRPDAIPWEDVTFASSRDALRLFIDGAKRVQ
jgi:ADP-ribose pyrophosphatase YjhB (NUDIX family)